MAIETLRRRSEFLRVRGGGRGSTPSLVIEGKLRAVALPYATTAVPDATASADGVAVRGARFGFTVTKKIGNAVVRNRIRRRLKAAVSLIANEQVKPGFDYVVIARKDALDLPFVRLKGDLETALSRVHDNRPRPPRRK